MAILRLTGPTVMHIKKKERNKEKKKSSNV